MLRAEPRAASVLLEPCGAVRCASCRACRSSLLSQTVVSEIINQTMVSESRGNVAIASHSGRSRAAVALNDATDDVSLAEAEPLGRGGCHLGDDRADADARPVAERHDRGDGGPDVVDGGVLRQLPGERDLPRVDRRGRPGPCPDRCSTRVPPASSTTSVSPFGPAAAVPSSSVAPVKLATNGSAGVARARPRCRVCRILPSTITPTWSASAAASSKSWVTRIVGSASSRSSSCSSIRTAAFVWASSAESGSSSRSTPGSSASARASATRWRSPPDSSPTRAASRCEIRNRSSRSATGRRGGRRSDVREHVEMREQRVLLEEVAHPASLRRHVDSLPRVEPGALAERDDAAPRPQQPGDDPQHRRLPGPRRPDERRRGAVRDGQLDGRVEAAKGMGEVTLSAIGSGA